MSREVSGTFPPGTPIVACRGLKKIYRTGNAEVHALDGIDLDIAAGDFATLSGPSGSGKSTLLNMIGALDNPDEGSVTVAGESLQSMDKRQLAELRLHKIGFIFQAYNLIPVLSARENVEFVLQLAGVSADDRRRRALEALREVGLEGKEDRRPAYLSGGQQQRIAVARALVGRPGIVLADEPSANLDSRTTEELVELMARLNVRLGITFLISTHDARVISHARRRIEMSDGRITADVLEAKPDAQTRI
jgi:putative ABC transport system ATP-binding protein